MSEMDMLVHGYREFYQKFFINHTSLYQKLKDGQQPKALVVACSDSRIDPAIITQANPGDIFSVRNVANIVPKYAQKDDNIGAALEFGICHLKISNIVILGHSHCAGVKAMSNINSVSDSDFIKDWVGKASPAKKRAIEKSSQDNKTSLDCLCEQESIILSLENLMTYPWLKSLVAEGKLQIHGWYFDIEAGQLSEYNPLENKFQTIEI